MNTEPRSGTEADGAADDSMLSPLPGEPGIPNVAAPSRMAVSRKGLLAVGLLVLSLVLVSALAIHRFAMSSRKGGAEDRLLRDKPAAAGIEPRRIEMPVAAASAASTVTSPRVPAILPTDEEQAEPIGVRRTGSTSPSGSVHAPVSPQDAPVLLVSTRPAQAGAAPRPTGTGQTTVEPAATDAEANAAAQDPLSATSRNLQAYQRQLQGLLDNLTRTAELANAGGPQPGAPLAPHAGPLPAPSMSQQAAGLFGGQLQGSATPRVAASMLGNRSLTLPKGTAFTCALKTRVISAASGMVSCQVLRNVYSDDGRVLLIERGSHLDGEYRIAAVRPGMVRIPVLWTRLRTPLGITVDIESPATGQLGESGIDGYVDNRWTERIGAAMLLSLIDDSVKLVIQNQASSGNSDRQADTIVLPSTTANTSKLAEKVLDSTINIPPLIYRNQGGIVGIYVARDLDFSPVYELRPTPAGSPKP